MDEVRSQSTVYAEDFYLIVTELCLDFTLFNFMMLRPFTEDQALLIVKQVLMAICHLHSLGIAHKDITFANILVDQEMTVKLAGFGCSIDLGQLPEIKKNLDSEDIATHKMLSQSLKFWQQLDCKMIGILLWKLIQGPSLGPSCELMTA